MKLIKCYVSSFGRLKNFEYDFESGLNTIKEDNGWGKSTLATFIKAMFYGINSGKRSVAENERIKYKPWNSTERFGGSVEFLWGDKQYRIERFFGNKEAEDSVRLFDVATGKEFSNTENLGKRVFEIDEEGFLSTTYFSQKDFQVKSNSSLTAKFNSVCEIQNTDTFDKALAKLEEKAKLYKYRGDKGLISDTKKEINFIDEKLESAERSATAVNVIKNDVKNLEEKVEILKNRTNLLTEKVALAGKADALAVKKQRYDELVKEKQSLEKELERLDTVLNGKLPEEKELDAFFNCYNDFVSVSAQKNACDEQVEKTKRDNGNSTGAKSSKNLTLSFILASVFLIAGIGLSFINLVAGIVGFILCLGCGFVGINAMNKSKKEKSIKDNELHQYLKRQKEYSILQNEYEQKLKEYLSRYNLQENCEFLQAFDVVRNCAYKKRTVLQGIERVDNSLAILSEEKELFSKTEQTKNVAQLKQELNEVQEDYAREANLLASKRASVKVHEEIVNSVPDIESKRAELIMRLEQFNEEHRILTLTGEYLKKADENLKVKYRQPLQDSLNKYLSLVTGKTSNVNIDIDLNVTVVENDGNKVPDYYSKGYQNLFEICKRFALTDVLFTGEKPFVILDDPFYNLDDVNLDGAINLVKKLSEEYQILYFVCHESRRA